MAWRIEEQVVRGKIDNRTPGRVIGRIWFAGRDKPVDLELKGNPWRDLAGHVLIFTNPDAKPGNAAQLSGYQLGMVGDMTASRKVKIPDCTMEELMDFCSAKQPFPWHWGNSLYLEWYSETNGRVVIDAAHYHLELDAEPVWSLSEKEEIAQQAVHAEALAKFMERIGMPMTEAPVENEEDEDDDDDDLPQSLEEAQADAEDARMQLLMDRVTVRLQRGELEFEEFDRIYNEERARVMRESGEKEPVLTPEELEERRQWIDEMNAIAEEMLMVLEAEKWKGTKPVEEEDHPLVVECSDLAIAFYHEIHNAGWLAEDAHEEHPLWEIQNGVTCASAKLAGALGMSSRCDEWPPDRMIAGNVIVRLKKARGYLRDALRGLDSAEEEALATPQWRHQSRLKVIGVLSQTEDLLSEARQVFTEGDYGRDDRDDRAVGDRDAGIDAP